MSEALAEGGGASCLLLLPASVRRPAARRSLPAQKQAAAAFADLVHEALLREVHLTPKPGLVDLRNTGAHRDMDVSTFLASAAAIRPWFAYFFRRGADLAEHDVSMVLPAIRPAGMACERVMFAATNGVNTHKGAIFAFGLLAAAAGRLWGRGETLARGPLCHEVMLIAGDLVGGELRRVAVPSTPGERLFCAHRLTGARGEAASGFATVCHGSLPVLERLLAMGVSVERALLAALLHLLEHNRDTNLVARGGLAGLAYARRSAAMLRRAGGVLTADFDARFRRLDDRFILRNLSPGGSADLLALTWCLHRLPRLALCPTANVSGETFHVLPRKLS